MTQPSEKRLYLCVVFWGKKYRDEFLNYLVPSLLSSRNLPIVERYTKVTLLVCTTSKDWLAVAETEELVALSVFAAPVHIEIPEPEPGTHPLLHMGHGHIAATTKAFEDRACLSFLTPDMVVSDGTIERLQKHMDAGDQVVLVGTVRFSQERFLPLLEDYRRDLRRQHQFPPLAPRDLARFALRSLHSETLEYDWTKPYFLSSAPDVPVAAFWPVPDSKGVVMHCACLLPILLDYASIETHDVETLRTWTFDGDYVMRNFGAAKRVHLVESTDEMIVVSWGPDAVGTRALSPRLALRIPIYGDYLRRALVRRGMNGPLFDPMRKAAFRCPTRWIVDPSGSHVWSRVERTANAQIARCFEPPTGMIDQMVSKVAMVHAELIVRVHLVPWRSYLEVVAAALRGDAPSLRRIGRRVRNLLVKGRYRDAG